jgi:hypothetical protein
MTSARRITITERRDVHRYTVTLINTKLKLLL